MARRSIRPSPAHYLLLAAIHRICQPGPKTEVAAWYDRTILRSQWGFDPERFTSQEFWDCFDLIPEEQLDQAQIRLLGLWKDKQWVSRRLLAYDTTTSIPTWPAPMSATTWRSGDTISKAGIICGRWV